MNARVCTGSGSIRCFTPFMSTFTASLNTLTWALTARLMAKRLTRFALEASHAAYANRLHAVAASDDMAQLPSVDVPTLILTSEHGRLIGKHAAALLWRGIADATEVVRSRTGQMFRLSQPGAYAKRIRDFLRARFTQLAQDNPKQTWPVRDLAALQAA